MIFYITNIFLDVVMGSVFWIVKNSTTGLYHIVYGNNNIENMDTKEQIKQLLIENKKQEEQIIHLTNSIDNLSLLIKNNYIN